MVYIVCDKRVETGTCESFEVARVNEISLQAVGAALVSVSTRRGDGGDFVGVYSDLYNEHFVKRKSLFRSRALVLRHVGAQSRLLKLQEPSEQEKGLEKKYPTQSQLPGTRVQCLKKEE